MDKSLARGYARMFFREMPKTESIRNHIRGSRLNKMLDLVEGCQRRTRVDRASKQFKSTLGTKFSNAEILRAQNSFVVGMGFAMSVASEVGLLDGSKGDEPVFCEDTLDLDRLFISANQQKTHYGMAPFASIGIHAVQRLLQREAISSKTMARDLKIALLLTEHVAMRCEDAGVDESTNNLSMLIPYRGGALVAALVGMKSQESELLYENVSNRLCIRTFLSGDMLSEAQRDRMTLIEPELTGLKISQLRGIGYFEDDQDEAVIGRRAEKWKDIFDQNARPWRVGMGSTSLAHEFQC